VARSNVSGRTDQGEVFHVDFPYKGTKLTKDPFKKVFDVFNWEDRIFTYHNPGVLSDGWSSAYVSLQCVQLHPLLKLLKGNGINPWRLS